MCGATEIAVHETSSAANPKVPMIFPCMRRKYTTWYKKAALTIVNRRYHKRALFLRLFVQTFGQTHALHGGVAEFFPHCITSSRAAALAADLIYLSSRSAQLGG
jgi:hypothetical protein